MSLPAAIEPRDVMLRLDKLAADLHGASAALAQTDRELEPLQKSYEDFLAAHEITLWNRSVDEGEKFPPEKLRERLGVRAMDQALRDRRDILVAKRKRLEQRLRDLRLECEVQRSLLSALKELEIR